ncbi:hypothetical protein FKW77_003921 [Venturia effusa]|uniref:Tetratricopeptide SHNi-TPR domain-containing protein n=1 Tax=Venturia effusa TaxID=50376 RepID=A0A517KW52_9PEZI|nr:hypothetical protein FKW77_003921 [Venturia effusa]
MSSLYAKHYSEAKKLFDKHEYEACIEKAKDFLADPDLPRYFAIKTSMLIVYASEDWNEAEMYRQEAEAVYKAAIEATTVLNTSKKTEATLALFRKDLDALGVHQEEERQRILEWKLLQRRLHHEEGEEDDDDDEEGEDDDEGREMEDSDLSKEKKAESLEVGVEAGVEATAGKLAELEIREAVVKKAESKGNK